MAVVFHCPSCRKRYEVADALAGKRGRCKHCQQTFTIPDGSGAPAVEPDDPYALDETPAPLPPRAGRPEAGDAPARAPAAKARYAPGTITLARLPTWGYGAYLGAALAALAASFVVRGEAKLLAVGLGMAVCVGPFVAAGFVYRYGEPFREGAVNGLLCLFVPLYRVYWRWSRRKTWKPTKLAPLTWRDAPPFALMLAFFPLFLAAAQEADEAVAARQPRNHVVFHAPRKARPQVEAVARVRPQVPVPVIPPPALPRPPRVEHARRQMAASPPPGFPGPRGAAPDGGSEPALDRHEALARKVMTRLDAMTGVLAGVRDPDTAAGAAPRLRALAQEIQEDGRQYVRLPALSAEDASTLRDRVGDARKAAADRYADQVARVRAIPGAGAALPPDVLAFSAFVPGTSLRLAPRGRTGPPSFPGPQAAPGPPPQPAETTVTLNVTGLDAPGARKAADADIGKIMAAAGGGWSMRANGGGDRMTYTVSPVTDPQGFADKLTFGKVTRVQGRVIDVSAGSP